MELNPPRGSKEPNGECIYPEDSDKVYVFNVAFWITNHSPSELPNTEISTLFESEVDASVNTENGEKIINATINIADLGGDIPCKRE